jgi:uncharacterized coiled-coil protein SlyX
MFESSPGRYRITIDGEEREITVSLGLKGELYRLITRKQIEYQKLSFKNLLSVEDKAAIKSIADELAEIQKSEEKDEEKIKELSERLDQAYAEAYTILDQRQKEFMEEIALGSIALSEECMADCIALLLTKRSDRGKVIEGEVLTRDDILWSDKYVAMQDELVDLLQAVVSYMQSTLKKISNLNQMLHGLGSELASPLEK